jgi:hypothetical protein
VNDQDALGNTAVTSSDHGTSTLVLQADACQQSGNNAYRWAPYMVTLSNSSSHARCALSCVVSLSSIQALLPPTGLSALLSAGSVNGAACQHSYSTSTHIAAVMVRRALVAVGEQNDFVDTDLVTEWPCFRVRAIQAESGQLDGVNIRFIAEPPTKLSIWSSAPIDWNPGCFASVSAAAFLPDTSLQHCLASMIQKPCFQKRMQQVCRPLEPLYGSAVLAVPGMSALIVFGGRALLSNSNDMSACKERLLPRDWRFQYHEELEQDMRYQIEEEIYGVHVLTASDAVSACAGIIHLTVAMFAAACSHCILSRSHMFDKSLIS